MQIEFLSEGYDIGFSVYRKTADPIQNFRESPSHIKSFCFLTFNFCCIQIGDPVRRL